MGAILPENAGVADIPQALCRQAHSSPSMESLPDAAIPAIERAYRTLTPASCYRLPIAVIYEAFRCDLKTLSIAPPSREVFHRWAQRVLDGDFSAHGLIQSNGELRPSSTVLLINGLRQQAGLLEGSAREMRKAADAMATALHARGDSEGEVA